MITCVICGHQVKTDLSKHLVRHHNMTCREYEEKYNSPAMTDEYRKYISNRGTKCITKLNSDPEFQKRHSKRMTDRNNKNWSDDNYRQFMHNMAVAEWEDPEYKDMMSKKVSEQWADPEIKAKQSSSLKKFYNSEKGIEVCLNRIKIRDENIYNGTKYRSSWEVILAKFLDENKIHYEYETLRFSYSLNNKNRIYIPDFYIPDYNLILEVKPEYKLLYDETIAKKDGVDKSYRYKFISGHEISGILNGSTTIESIIWEKDPYEEASRVEFKRIRNREHPLEDKTIMDDDIVCSVQ